MLEFDRRIEERKIEMVAISLYRGNLHRVPAVPRRWLLPADRISLKDFRSLLSRRSAALSRLSSAPGTSSNATSDLLRVKQEKEEEAEPENAVECSTQPQAEQPLKGTDPKEEEREGKPALKGKGRDGDECVAKSVAGSGSSPGPNPIVQESVPDPADGHRNSQGEKAVAVSQNPNLEANKNLEAVTDQEKRRREIEEKLQILNEKKHNLVQVLKQILNAEEELKRRNNMQGMTIRPSGPLHIDTTNDSGSLTRQVNPRLGSDANLGGEMEGGEPDDISNHNMHSRHLLRMSSTSPSSDSPLRRPYNQHNAVPHPSRATGSPSRFAPTGHQSHPTNLPTVSVSGTSYIASSPSPAASGGTSVFRDARLPSPWN